MKKLIISIILILLVVAVITSVQNRFDVRESEDREMIFKALGKWAAKAAGNIGRITAYAIKQDWKTEKPDRNETIGADSSINPDSGTGFTKADER